jgi:hypothetical protein
MRENQQMHQLLNLLYNPLEGISLGPLNSKYFFACVIHKKVNFDVI